MNSPSPSPSASADAPLSSARRETLRVLLAMLVPASPDGRMPAAVDLPQVLQHVAHLAAEVPALTDGLDRLEHEAIARHGAAFAILDHDSRATLLDGFGARHPAVLQRLALETVTCYYQQDGVLERLGMEARPPYPNGYQVLAGDLTLLNAVRARGKTYRDAS
jgi:hypothetical protein